MISISKLRRKINDSNIGQKVNGSIPGILVEGASRGITDGISTALNLGFAGLSVGGAIVFHGIRKPKLAAQDVETAGFFYVLAGLKPTQEYKDTHYSHKSKLYQPTIDAKGKAVMERIPTTNAIIYKIAERSPQIAKRLAVFRNKKLTKIYRQNYVETQRMDKTAEEKKTEIFKPLENLICSNLTLLSWMGGQSNDLSKRTLLTVIAPAYRENDPNGHCAGYHIALDEGDLSVDYNLNSPCIDLTCKVSKMVHIADRGRTFVSLKNKDLFVIHSTKETLPQGSDWPKRSTSVKDYLAKGRELTVDNDRGEKK